MLLLKVSATKRTLLNYPKLPNNIKTFQCYVCTYLPTSYLSCFLVFSKMDRLIFGYTYLPIYVPTHLLLIFLLFFEMDRIICFYILIIHINHSVSLCSYKISHYLNLYVIKLHSRNLGKLLQQNTIILCKSNVTYIFIIRRLFYYLTTYFGLNSEVRPELLKCKSNHYGKTE